MHDFGYPGKKKKYTLCCGISIAASDQPNLNKGWANASWDEKQDIIAAHTYFERGMFYFLANDPEVPNVYFHSEPSKYGPVYGPVYGFLACTSIQNPCGI